MKISVYITTYDNEWLEKLNISASELLREAIEIERNKHIDFMNERRRQYNAIRNKENQDNKTS